MKHANAILALSAILFFQSSAATEQRRTPEQFASGARVERLPNGDYQVTYQVASGERQEVYVVSAPKIRPTISSSVTSQSDGAFRYEYRLSNALGAEHDIHAASFEVILPVRSVAAPQWWDTMQTRSTQRLSFYHVVSGDTLGGVAAGLSVNGFVIESESLPGPTQVRLRSSGGAVQIPADMPLDARAYVESLSARLDHLVEWAITPSIPHGRNEPELTPAVLVSRIRERYVGPLTLSKHRSATKLASELRRVAARLDGSPRELDLLDSVIALATAPQPDEWSRTIGTALGVALEFARQRRYDGG